jgi:hypothetical protein
MSSPFSSVLIACSSFFTFRPLFLELAAVGESPSCGDDAALLFGVLAEGALPLPTEGLDFAALLLFVGDGEASEKRKKLW